MLLLALQAALHALTRAGLVDVPRAGIARHAHGQVRNALRPCHDGTVGRFRRCVVHAQRSDFVPAYGSGSGSDDLKLVLQVIVGWRHPIGVLLDQKSLFAGLP